MGKLVTLLAIGAVLMLGVAFLAPQDANGKLFSADNFANAFSLGGLQERIKRMTPSHVFTVTADTVSKTAGAVLGVTSKTLGPVIDLTRDPGETVKDAAQDVADTFIPQTKEEKRIELIGKLEARVAELEEETGEQNEAVVTLTEEINKLVQELKRVREDGGIIDAVIEGTKKTLAPGQESTCECGSQ